MDFICFGSFHVSPFLTAYDNVQTLAVLVTVLGERVYLKWFHCFNSMSQVSSLSREINKRRLFLSNYLAGKLMYVLVFITYFFTVTSSVANSGFLHIYLMIWEDLFVLFYWYSEMRIRKWELKSEDCQFPMSIALDPCYVDPG